MVLYRIRIDDLTSPSPTIEIMLIANFVWRHVSTESYTILETTYLLKEYQSRVIHNWLAIFVKRLMGAQIAMYRRFS